MEYYGTSLTEVGHYCWDLNSESLSKRWDRFDQLMKGTHPIDVYRSKNLQKGFVTYWQQNGYSVLSITGSCSDRRGGTVSIFFEKGDIDKKQMIDLVFENTVVKKMLSKMPYPLSLQE